MKIGWDRSSIRLRVTASEIETLLRGATVNEEVTLPWGGHWSATIVPSDAATTTSLTLETGHLRLFLTLADRDRLADPESTQIAFGVARGDDNRAEGAKRCSGRCERCRAARSAATEFPQPDPLHYIIEKIMPTGSRDLPAPANVWRPLAILNASAASAPATA
jgi:hypothetical protein